MLTLSERIQQLQTYLSYYYIDFDTPTERLQSLYSDFAKLKLLNEYGYKANVNYWRTILLDCNLHGYLNTGDHVCMIHQSELPELFYQSKLGKPLCLDTVIEDMRKDTKYLLTQKEYEHTYPVTTTNPSSLNWLRWFVDWILPSTPSDVYIVMPTIDEYAKIMVQQHYKKPLCSALDNLFTWDEFKAQYRAIPCYQETCVQLSDMDLWFVLRYLVHHYGVAVQDTFKTFGHQSTVIKFPERTESERTKAVISQEDKAIVSLKAACTALHYQVDQLEIKAQEFLQVAQQHYTFHRKPQAMFMLRKKKQIEHLLEQRYKTLDTMETVLLKIEASQNDLYMVQAFNLGTETLRKMLAHHSFDKIQETMDELQEALDDHEQVEHALTQGHHVIVDQDEQALEEQLESLALEEQALTQPIDTQSELMRLQQVLSSLNVPSHTTKQKQAQLA